MGFFARPRLSDEQFVQNKDDVLTLSGQTRIATTTGLTLTDGSGGNIIITASGASTNFDVLTYCNGVISLQTPTASGGSGTYTCASPTTCTVGGLPAGTPIYGSGITTILQCILTPTLNPTLTSPSISSFTINPTSLIYEVGSVANITSTTCFNAGCINPQYTSTSDCRSGVPDYYRYSNFGVVACVTNPVDNDVYSFGAHTITNGSNTISARVYYNAGVQPYDSNGSAYSSPLPSGCTSTVSKTITGLYPWYWGTEASGGAASGVNRPSACCIKDVITGGTYTCKCVASSTSTLQVNFGSSSDDYIWFAIPQASTSKTIWYADALNNGSIGGAVSSGGNLFPDPDLTTNITTVCWSGQTYKIYISNYQSASAVSMELRNS